MELETQERNSQFQDKKNDEIQIGRKKNHKIAQLHILRIKNNKLNDIVQKTKKIIRVNNSIRFFGI